MKKWIWIVATAAILLAFVGGFTAGRSYPPGWKKVAQVECLRKMWKPYPLNLEQLKAVRALEHDPEAVRALLFEWISQEQIDAKFLRLRGPTVPQLPDETHLGIARSKILLKSWVPGQMTFTEPTPEQVKKEAGIK